LQGRNASSVSIAANISPCCLLFSSFAPCCLVAQRHLHLEQQIKEALQQHVEHQKQQQQQQPLDAASPSSLLVNWAQADSIQAQGIMAQEVSSAAAGGFCGCSCSCQVQLWYLFRGILKSLLFFCFIWHPCCNWKLRAL
jgi:hypothetical protein